MTRLLENRADIAELVNTFYQNVRADDLLAPIFDEIAQIDWDEHLPKMYDFWETVLWGSDIYKGNPMLIHIGLSQLTPLTALHFERWLSLFRAAVDQLFEGKQAEAIKTKAMTIATMMQLKIEKHGNAGVQIQPPKPIGA